MRSGRLFEEDAGRKHPSREHKPMDQPAGSHDDWDAEHPRRFDGSGGGGGNRNHGPGWFLHDDRDGQTGFNKPRDGNRVAPVGQTPEEWEGNTRGVGFDRGGGAGGGGGRGSRGGRNGGSAAASAPAPAPPPDVWFYKDPSGNEQGPFAAPKLLKWVEQGYFSSDLPVRKDPNRTYTPLDNLLDGLKAEAAAASAAVGRSTVRVLTVPAPKPVQREPRRSGGGNRRNRGGYDERDAEPPARPDGRPHPAEALLSDGMRRPREQQRQPNRQPAQAGWDGIQQGGAGASTNGRGTSAGRTGWEDSSPKAGAGDGGEDPGYERPRGTAFGAAGARSPRREARPRRSAAEAAAPDPRTKPKVSNSEWTIARKLFYVQGKQGSELPMWRYIDPAGACQGPFESMEMMKWFEGAFLNASLLICGTDRKVSPPNLPDTELYMTLGDNMARIRSGKTYKPITPADIREFRKTGRKPWETHDAEAAAAAAAAAPSGSQAAPQDADEAEPDTEEEDGEVRPDTDLAASKGPAAPETVHSSSRNGPAQTHAAAVEADSSEDEEGEITDEPALNAEAEEGDVRDVRGMRAAASDDEEDLDEDAEEDDDDSVGSLADVQEAPATPTAAAEAPATPAAVAEAASGMEHSQDQVPTESTAAVSVQNAAASALTGAGTIAGGSPPVGPPAASPAEQEQPGEVPAPAAAAQQSPGSPTGFAAASEAASAAPAEAAASSPARPAARSPASAALPAAASPPRGGGGGVSGIFGGLLSRLGGGGATAGHSRAEGASQAPVAAEQEPQQGSLEMVTDESGSEDEEAQLEAAEHRAAYNLEAPSTAPATTGGSRTGGSTQTGSGLGTAAGGGNAVPRAAENGAAQPPAEVNTQEDRGSSVLEAFSGDEQNEADVGDEVQDDDQPSHSPATGRSMLWQSATAELSRQCHAFKLALQEECVACLIKPQTPSMMQV